MPNKLKDEVKVWKPVKPGSRQAEILDLIAQAGDEGLTVHEIHDVIGGEPNSFPPAGGGKKLDYCDLRTVAANITHLINKGRVVADPKLTRVGPHGRLVTAYVLTAN